MADPIKIGDKEYSVEEIGEKLTQFDELSSER